MKFLIASILGFAVGAQVYAIDGTWAGGGVWEMDDARYGYKVSIERRDTEKAEKTIAALTMKSKWLDLKTGEIKEESHQFEEVINKKDHTIEFFSKNGEEKTLLGKGNCEVVEFDGEKALSCDLKYSDRGWAVDVNALFCFKTETLVRNGKMAKNEVRGEFTEILHKQ